jgi:hypothetical protein
MGAKFLLFIFQAFAKQTQLQNLHLRPLRHIRLLDL